MDSFGNLKTTLRDGRRAAGPAAAGDAPERRVNGIRRAATVASASFGVRDGDMASAPGSSGHEKRFWELFQRGSAFQTLGNPRAGAPFEVDWQEL